MRLILRFPELWIGPFLLPLGGAWLWAGLLLMGFGAGRMVFTEGGGR